jgi:hypothetical protein
MFRRHRVALMAAGLGAALSAVLAMAAADPAAATVRIQRDAGGRVGTYIDAFAAVRNSGQRVVIDGTCLSACTMVLGLVPRERVCATRRALLGFHAAWSRDDRGRPVRNAAATQILWDIYPEEVRSWIARNGGLSSKMIYLRGRELAAIVPTCAAEPRARRAPSIARKPTRQKAAPTFATR